MKRGLGWVAALASSWMFAAVSGACDSGAPDPQACCGCLCGDPTWSCTKETCLDEEGRARALVPEAGFFELPGSDSTSYAGEVRTPRARVWYSFQPAETDPEHKPLLVLMNGMGGPALALLAFNTGHFTLDPTYTNGQPFAENPHRWTDFGNLLYVDQPGAGYSYHLPRADGSTPTFQWDAFADGADYLRVLFRFVARHPQLARAPIVLVGESGGGLKGASMTHIMLEYPSLLSGGTFQDPELHHEILKFLVARRPDLDPADWTPEDIARVFTHHVFIDPYLAHDQLGRTLQPADVPGCLPDGDVLQCDATAEEEELIKHHVGAAITDPVVLSQFLRCDVTSVEWLHADARAGAYPRTGEPFDVTDETQLIATFGEPEPGDHYYVLQRRDPPFYGELQTNQDHGRTALRAIRAIPTMITRGRYDLIFNPMFLPPALALYTDVLTSATMVATEPASAERPGQLELVYRDDLSYAGGTRIVRFPEYLAGHAVSKGAPAELKEDVAAFID